MCIGAISETQEIGKIGVESKEMVEEETAAGGGKPRRRTVTADLLESTPNALGYWPRP
jgi:hypothetical protein